MLIILTFYNYFITTPSSENSASSVPYFKQHHSILCGLYNYFHTSPSHYSALKEMMDILHDPEVHIQQVHSIRWLTMHRAIRKCFRSLLSTLAMLANADVIAKGLYNSVTEYKFIVFIFLEIWLTSATSSNKTTLTSHKYKVQLKVLLITLGQLTSTVKLIIWEEST